MDLLGDLETATTPRVRFCKAKIVLDALTPEQKALADRLTPERLAPILTRNGQPIGASCIRRHRAGACQC